MTIRTGTLLVLLAISAGCQTPQSPNAAASKARALGASNHEIGALGRRFVDQLQGDMRETLPPNVGGLDCGPTDDGPVVEIPVDDDCTQGVCGTMIPVKPDEFRPQDIFVVPDEPDCDELCNICQRGENNCTTPPADCECEPGQSTNESFVPASGE